MEYGCESGCRDGKSRVIDKEGNLVSVGGVKVQKKEVKNPALAHVKTVSQSEVKGGK